MKTPVSCGIHDYMAFEPCPQCQMIGALAANVLIAARILRETCGKAVEKWVPEEVKTAGTRVVDAIHLYDSSSETRRKPHDD